MVKKIIINGQVELTSENGYYLQEINGLGYVTKYSVNEILSRHGAKLGNAVLRNKTISVVIIVGANSFEDLITKRNTLFKYLTVNNYSPDDKIIFEFVLANNLSIVITGIIKELPNDLKANHLTTTPLIFTLETEYPFLISKQQYQVILQVAKGGGAAVPMMIPLNFSQGASSPTPIANGGNIFSYPVLRFAGPLTNPILTDVDSNKTLSLAVTLTSGQYYDIDTFERTVLDHTGSNKLDKLTGDFLVIPAGENRFKLTTDNPSESGTVNITYPYSYVSI